jgi:mannitol-1-/sugar-/sorbitol-6-phosphatase
VAERISVEAAGLLFDNDGVIVSSIASVNRCWRRWAAHYGVPVAADYEIEHGTRAVDIMQKLLPGVDTVEGLRLIEDMELEDIADLEVLPGVRVLLESLPPERWAIVSSATWRLLVGRLKAAKLPVPERIVSGDRVVHGKPHPEPYLRGAEMIHARPEDCIVIEDAPSGVGAGKAAGCRVLGVLGTHTEAELREAGADWVVRSLEDMSGTPATGGLLVSFDAL